VVGEACRFDAQTSCCEHLPALVDTDDTAPGAAYQLDRNGRGACGDIEDGVVGSDVHPRHQESPPAGILAERKQPGVAVVGRSERSEELCGIHGGRVYGDRVALQDDLQEIASTAAGYAEDGEELAGILAAEPSPGNRVYLCAYRAGEQHSWLALDEAGRPVADRELVRRAASLVALSEVAEESAGGGELDELRSRLVALRLTENPPGIDEAEQAVIALQEVIGASPRVATAAFLDDVGVATRKLEQALGDQGLSPFAEAMKAAARAVEDFTSDVDANYKRAATV
jgi:hypothetical protein